MIKKMWLGGAVKLVSGNARVALKTPLVAVALSILVAGCNLKRAPHADAGATADPSRPVATASASPPPSPLEEILTVPSLAGAIEAVKPKMADTVDDIDPGTALLTVWAMKHMRWTDVAVTTDETTYALVQKDSEEARGKRLCVPGSVIQIEVDKGDQGKDYFGLLISGSGNIYRFYAVGSTGAIVEQTYARFCGVVTGKYEYSNSGGGTGHAVKLVGMFDLPENKPAKTAR